jgi:hypothetical protein
MDPTHHPLSLPFPCLSSPLLAVAPTRLGRGRTCATPRPMAPNLAAPAPPCPSGASASPLWRSLCMLRVCAQLLPHALGCYCCARQAHGHPLLRQSHHYCANGALVVGQSCLPNFAVPRKLASTQNMSS